MYDGTCLQPGCVDQAHALRLCGKHYQQARRTRGIPQREVNAVRFWSKVEITETCWLWDGRKADSGYGRFAQDGKEKMAHRVAYELMVGPIPEGLVIDHLCRVHNCVRPEHLEPVTTQENLMRGDTFQARNAAKTHCKWGHEFSALNTRITPKGARECKECKREACRRRRRKTVQVGR